MIKTIIVISFVIALIFLGVALTWWLYYYHLLSACAVNPNIWCWTDWTCPGDNIGDYSCPSQSLYGCHPGVTRDEDFCLEGGAGVGTAICNCKNSDDVNSTCSCDWNAIGSAWTSDGGSCGTQYCTTDTSANLNNCQGN